MNIKDLIEIKVLVNKMSKAQKKVLETYYKNKPILTDAQKEIFKIIKEN